MRGWCRLAVGPAAGQQGYLDSFNRSTDTQHIAVLARMSIQQHLVMLQEIQAMLA